MHSEHYNARALGLLTRVDFTDSLSDYYNYFNQGKMERKCFGDWKVKGIPTEVLAREHLRRFGVEHYWDLALSETVIEQGKDE